LFFDGSTTRVVTTCDCAVQSQYSGKIQEWVAAGLYEIGICERPILHEGLEERRFTFETLCAIPEGAGLAEDATVTPSALDDYPFIIMGADHMVTRRTREAFHSNGSHFRVRCHTDLFRNALNLVKQGLGAAMIDPFTLASDDGQGYVVRRLEPTVHLDIVIVTRRDRPISVVGQEFLDQIIPQMEKIAIDVTQDRIDA